jgi:hypothetical protein
MCRSHCAMHPQEEFRSIRAQMATAQNLDVPQNAMPESPVIEEWPQMARCQRGRRPAFACRVARTFCFST